MWHYNRQVRQVYATSHKMNVYAAISGVPGSYWKKVKPIAPDGVTNVCTLLSTAKANNRLVHVYVVANEIERVIEN